METLPNISAKTKVVSNEQSKKAAWTASLKKLSLANSSLHVEDRNLNTPVILDIEKAALDIHDTSLDLSRSSPIKAAFQVKQGGQFNAQGKITPLPLKADLTFKLSQLTLKPVGPYISQFAFLKLNGGGSV